MNGDGFENIFICNRSEINKLSETLPFSQRWYFRGQSNSNYKLESTFERAYDFLYDPGIRKSSKGIPDLLQLQENHILNEFKKRAHLYYPNITFYEKNDIDVFSLIRHYGGPSRMLDFTTSFMISLFFAIPSKNSNYSSIWCIKDKTLENTFLETHPDIKIRRSMLDIDDFHKICIKYANMSISGEFKDEAIIPINPNFMNERSSIQKGLFLFPCKIESTFNENLSNMLNIPLNHFSNKKLRRCPKRGSVKHLLENSSVIKINIKSSLKMDILQILQECNISYMSLFPDFEGFVKSLNYPSEIMGSVFRKFLMK